MRSAISLLIIPLFLIPFFVFASGAEDALQGLQTTAYTSGAGSPNVDIAVFVGNIIRALLALLGVIVLIFMVYGGYLWMASGGNEQMVKKSKDILFNTIIGLIIVIAAFAITDFIMKGISGAVNSSGTADECINTDGDPVPAESGKSCTKSDGSSGVCNGSGGCI